jgi:hypothetical protein
MKRSGARAAISGNASLSTLEQDLMGGEHTDELMVVVVVMVVVLVMLVLIVVVVVGRGGDSYYISK